ncbi:MAG: pyridoxamine 5'-phosphate oxidase [bacterium]|nr:pyridoxamine 5'-phosphate oxidase [bacterium]
MNKNSIADIRKDYIFGESTGLKEEDVSGDPFDQFERWFSEKVSSGDPESNAMFIATATKDGKPSLRTVLLKNFDSNGFTFYTNYSSRKGKELEENPFASILFFWKESERQIRIEGIAEKVSRQESDEYFHKRPFESQLAALCSDQSNVIENREVIEKRFTELKKQYENKTIPLPDDWGGYRLIPDKFEFWQGRQNRMHDRIAYTKINSEWKIERLAP